MSGVPGFLRIHSTPKTLYFSLNRELSLPTEAAQRTKAKESTVFILMLVNSLERSSALLQSSSVAEKMMKQMGTAPLY